MESTETKSLSKSEERDRLLRVMAAISFLIFFQGYMVAPMIPGLATTFGLSTQRIGLVVPAYLIPYGITTLPILLV
jgi:predicted MFS family arabinose efflux permease